MKILVVDDHPLVRKGIVSALAYEEGIEEIKEAGSIMEALSVLEKQQPEIVLIDLNLGREDGLEIVKSAKGRGVNSKFIVVTSSSRKDDFTRAQEIGVEGYILKEAFVEDIVYGLKVVTRGKKFYDPELMQHHRENQSTNLEELTPREKEVLLEIGKGMSNTQIAEILYISEHTVKKHVSRILEKLNLHHRTEAALFINNLACRS